MPSDMYGSAIKQNMILRVETVEGRYFYSDLVRFLHIFRTKYNKQKQQQKKNK